MKNAARKGGGAAWRSPQSEQNRKKLTKLSALCYDGDRRCCIQAVSHFPLRGGDADGKRATGESPSFRGVLSHDPGDHDIHIPKSVLTARLVPKRST